MENKTPHAKAVQDALDLATDRGIQFADRPARIRWWNRVAHEIKNADIARRDGRMIDYNHFVSILVAYTMSEYGTVVEEVLRPYQIRMDRLEIRRGA